MTPWGEIQGDTASTDNGVELGDILSNGEMIVLTVSGPETYYDYHGHNMGTQYLLCEKFAQSLGVSLRVELCKDTMEMISRLKQGEGDIIACMLPKRKYKSEKIDFCGARVDSLNKQWAIAKGNDQLKDTLNRWFKPEMLSQTIKEENLRLSTKSIKRKVYAPFLNKQSGIISQYDPLFKRYSPIARWDWRMLAAQCYQESCFDRYAKSWAGACGLMQIMPSTASHLGLSQGQVYDPEKNIEASVRYLAELSLLMRDVREKKERDLFVLACYNGGYNHIRDAMTLAQQSGKNPRIWRNTAPYVLALSDPKFYTNPAVKYGYMRGSETVDYVDRIRQRYAQYRGVPYTGNTVSLHGLDIHPLPTAKGQQQRPNAVSNSPFVPHKAKKKRKFNI